MNRTHFSNEISVMKRIEVDRLEALINFTSVVYILDIH